METYKIYKAQLPLPTWPKFLSGIAAHNVILVVDHNGKIISEFNGLATNFDKNTPLRKSDDTGLPIAYSNMGLVKPIGYKPSDRLVVYEDENGGYFSKGSMLKNHQLVFEGSREEVEHRLDMMRQAARELNKRDLRYPILGIVDIVPPLNDGWMVNSNSIASSLLAAARLPDPDLGWSLTPGEGKILFNIDEINNIYCSTKTPEERRLERERNEREQMCPKQKEPEPELKPECKPSRDRNLESGLDYSRSRQGSALQWEDWPQEKQPDNAQPAEQPYRPPLPDAEPKLPEPWSIDPF